MESGGGLTLREVCTISQGSMCHLRNEAGDDCVALAAATH
jgi:hypothetical protein